MKKTSTFQNGLIWFGAGVSLAEILRYWGDDPGTEVIVLYTEGFADPQAEMAYYMQLGVDGVFTDFPDTGVAALQAAAVPEPQTWALLLGGVALLGGLRHRQQRAGRQS